MRAGEGRSLKEDLASLPRFGDLSVEWWQPGVPEVVGEPGGLALETAGRIFAQARVAVLEEGRRKRAEGMKLAKIGRDLYRADDRYVVDAILGLCRHRHFERHNGKKRKQAGVPLVRSKRLIAAEDAEGQADRRDHDRGPTQNGLSTLLSLGARANARRGEARGGQKP